MLRVDHDKNAISTDARSFVLRVLNDVIRPSEVWGWEKSIDTVIFADKLIVEGGV